MDLFTLQHTEPPPPAACGGPVKQYPALSEALVSEDVLNTHRSHIRIMR